MKTLTDFTNDYNDEMLTHLKIEFAKYLINETRGIFDGCEEIASYFVKRTKEKINKGIYKDNIISKKSVKLKWFDSLKYTFDCNNQYDCIEGHTNFKPELDSNDKIINNKDFDFTITFPLKYDVDDLRGIIMHELTHIYFCGNMGGKEKYTPMKQGIGYDRYSSFFTKTPKNASKEDIELNNVKYILYILDTDEVDAFISNFKTDIQKESKKENSKIKTPNDALVYLRSHFQYVFYENIYKDAINDNLDKTYNNLIENYKKIVTKDKEKSNRQIKSLLKYKAVRAWRKLITKLPKICADTIQYDNMHTRTVSEDFVKNMLNKLYGNKP